MREGESRLLQLSVQIGTPIGAAGPAADFSAIVRTGQKDQQNYLMGTRNSPKTRLRNRSIQLFGNLAASEWPRSSKISSACCRARKGSQ